MSRNIWTLLRLTFNWHLNSRYCPALLSCSVISSNNILPKLLPLQQGSEGEILRNWPSFHGCHSQEATSNTANDASWRGGNLRMISCTSGKDSCSLQMGRINSKPPNSPSDGAKPIGSNWRASQPRSAHQHLRQCLHHASKRCTRMVVRSSEVEELHKFTFSKVLDSEGVHA